VALLDVLEAHQFGSDERQSGRTSDIINRSMMTRSGHREVRYDVADRSEFRLIP
jgi:hypothetical protein